MSGGRMYYVQFFTVLVQEQSSFQSFYNTLSGALFNNIFFNNKTKHRKN